MPNDRHPLGEAFVEDGGIAYTWRWNIDSVDWFDWTDMSQDMLNALDKRKERVGEGEEKGRSDRGGVVEDI